MLRRVGVLVVSATIIYSAFVTGASAAAPDFDPPSPGAQLVSRDTAAGAEAVRAALSSLNSVKVGQRATVINVTGDSGPHAITVDYAELSRDRRAAGLGWLAGGYIGLGAVGRFVRLLRATGLVGQ